MTEHNLKVWPQYFKVLLNEEKPFEMRKNDRDFQLDDVLSLHEWDPKTESYTGQYVVRYVTYILGDNWPGIETGYCVMGLSAYPRNSDLL